MDNFLIQSKELLGLIIAAAIAVGAGAIPTGKWMYKKHKENAESNALKITNHNNIDLGSSSVGAMRPNTSTQTISHPGLNVSPHVISDIIPEAIVMQLQRMEKSIDHIETMLITEGHIHHTQTTYLDGLRNEVSKLREDIIELRIRIGHN